MTKFWMGIFFAILSSASFAKEVGPHIGVSKYSRISQSSPTHVFFREFTLGSDGLKPINSLEVFANGTPVQSTYLPRSGHWAFEDNLNYWKENPIKSELQTPREGVALNECGLMVLNNFFPLMQMQERGVITPEYARKEMFADANRYHPDQVTYVDIYRPQLESIVRRQHEGMIPVGARLRPDYHGPELLGVREDVETLEVLRDGDGIPYLDHIEKRLMRGKNYLNRVAKRTFFDVKTASVRLVGRGRNPNDLTKKLPLEFTASGEPFTLDQKNYKAVWEVGRTASNKFHQMDHLYGLKAALEQAAHEASLLGISEDEALIVAHSPDRAHHLLYRKSYGLEEMGPHPDSAHHRIMGGSITKFRQAIDKLLQDKEGIVVHPLRSTASRISWIQNDFHFSLPLAGKEASFRDFSQNVWHDGSRFPTTWLEHKATQMGARFPHGRFDRSVLREEVVHISPLYQPVAIPRNDRLEARMNWYYEVHQGDDHSSFMKSRYLQERALVIDPSPEVMAGKEMDWKSVISQALGYAQEHHIPKIAIPARKANPLPPPELVRLGREEVLARDHYQAQVTSALGVREHFIEGDDISIFWLDVEKALKSVLPTPAQIQKPIDRYWKEPLYSF